MIVRQIPSEEGLANSIFFISHFNQYHRLGIMGKRENILWQSHRLVTCVYRTRAVVCRNIYTHLPPLFLKAGRILFVWLVITLTVSSVCLYHALCPPCYTWCYAHCRHDDTILRGGVVAEFLYSEPYLAPHVVTPHTPATYDEILPQEPCLAHAPARLSSSQGYTHTAH